MELITGDSVKIPVEGKAITKCSIEHLAGRPAFDSSQTLIITISQY